MNAVAAQLKCPKCNGRGSKVYGFVNICEYTCSTCKGTGRVTQQHLDKIQRFKDNRAKAANTIANRAAEWKVQHADLWEWLTANSFDFSNSMIDSIERYGRLTDNQINAVRRCIAKQAERRAERLRAQEDSKTELTGVVAVVEAMRKAKFLGNKKPKIRTKEITFTFAPDNGKNADHVYAKATGGLYLGKIDFSGRLTPSRDCVGEVLETLKRVASDPITAAIDYGKQTGVCACCGRDLEDEKSVERGIGPICYDKYF